VRNTLHYPPLPSMRIIADLFAYCGAEHAQVSTASRSRAYHMQEAGATADLELAYTLADGLGIPADRRQAGIDIDAFAPAPELLLGPSQETSSWRSPNARGAWLWSEMVAQFSPKIQSRVALRARHSQTSGWSLTAPGPVNNVARTCLEALAAVGGQTQSLQHELARRGDGAAHRFSARIARNTQLYLQQETGNLARTFLRESVGPVYGPAPKDQGAQIPVSCWR